MVYKGKKILGLIAARGGSKGLPGKNVKLLLGKPLIAWTIEQGKESKYLDKLIVSTDDEEIAKVSKTFGADVPFMRPSALAQDNSPIFDTILHALDYLEKGGEVFDVLVLLECTSPMRYRDDIDGLVKTLIDNGNADSVIGVVELSNDHPAWASKVVNGKLEKYCPDAENKKDTQRQQLGKAYLSYSVYVTWKRNCAKYRSFSQPNTVPFFLKREQKLDIDDEVDYLLAESILKKYLKKEEE